MRVQAPRPSPGDGRAWAIHPSRQLSQRATFRPPSRLLPGSRKAVLTHPEGRLQKLPPRGPLPAVSTSIPLLPPVPFAAAAAAAAIFPRARRPRSRPLPASVRRRRMRSVPGARA